MDEMEFTEAEGDMNDSVPEYQRYDALIYDTGGGTCDVSVLTIEDGIVEVGEANGEIILAPCSADSVGVFDPAAVSLRGESLYLDSLFTQLIGVCKFRRAAPAANSRTGHSLSGPPMQPSSNFSATSPSMVAVAKSFACVFRPASPVIDRRWHKTL